MPRNLAEKLELLVDNFQKSTRSIMLIYNCNRAAKIDYAQTNKALNLLVKQGKILKNVERDNCVKYFKAD